MPKPCKRHRGAMYSHWDYMRNVEVIRRWCFVCGSR